MGYRASLELVLDCERPMSLATFWCEALDYLALHMDSNLAVLVPNKGGSPPLLLQRVPEPKAGKNRRHVDVVVNDIDAEVKRLQGLRARRIDEAALSLSGTPWIRMFDPEQNKFCVSTGLEW
jgi:hypothetical protein